MTTRQHRNPWFRSEVRTDLSAETWAYIAGIFDGEGHLRHHQGAWRLRISQVTASGLCQWLWDTVGTGALTVITHQPANRKPMLLWRCDRQADILDFLLHVEPYIIVKRDITERALADLGVCRRH